MNPSHQSDHSRTVLTSHLFYVYDAFSSFYFFLCSESDDDDEYIESDVGGSGSESTSVSCFAHFNVELCFDQIISIRVGMSSIFSRSSIYFIFCSSI